MVLYHGPYRLRVPFCPVAGVFVAWRKPSAGVPLVMAAAALTPATVRPAVSPTSGRQARFDEAGGMQRHDHLRHL